MIDVMLQSNKGDLNIKNQNFRNMMITAIIYNALKTFNRKTF